MKKIKITTTFLLEVPDDTKEDDLILTKKANDSFAIIISSSPEQNCKIEDYDFTSAKETNVHCLDCLDDGEEWLIEVAQRLSVNQSTAFNSDQCWESVSFFLPEKIEKYNVRMLMDRAWRLSSSAPTRMEEHLKRIGLDTPKV